MNLYFEFMNRKIIDIQCFILFYFYFLSLFLMKISRSKETKSTSSLFKTPCKRHYKSKETER